MDISDPNSTPTVLILGSCQFPPDILRNRVAHKTRARIADFIRNNIKNRTPRPEFALLMAGDSIYADATAGLFDPVDEIDRYKKAYEQVQESSQEKNLTRTNVLRYSTIDDHEIIDNWEPINPQNRSSTDNRYKTDENDILMLQGKRHFIQDTQLPGKNMQTYFGKDQKTILKNVKDFNLWRSVEIESAPVFLMDTRTERDSRTLENLDSAKLFSNKQFDALETWLREQQDIDDRTPGSFPRPKFILSGSMPLPRTRRIASALTSENNKTSIDKSYQLGSDSWDGYPETLNKVLALLGEVGTRNLFFLSGDAHIPCIASVTIKSTHGNSELTCGSIHAAPLYAPFPFANAKSRDYCTTDNFSFSLNNKNYDISTEAEFPEPGDGFVIVDNSDTEKGKLYVDFHNQDNSCIRKTILLTRKC